MAVIDLTNQPNVSDAASKGIIKIIEAMAASKQAETELQKQVMLDKYKRQADLQDKQTQAQNEQQDWSSYLNQSTQQDNQQGNPTTNTSGMANSATPAQVVSPVGGAMPQGYNPTQPPMSTVDPSQQAANDAAQPQATPVVQPQVQQTPQTQGKQPIDISPIQNNDFQVPSYNGQKLPSAMELLAGSKLSGEKINGNALRLYHNLWQQAGRGQANEDGLNKLATFAWGDKLVSKDDNGSLSGIDTANLSPDEIGSALKSKNPGEYSYLEGLKDGKVNIAGRTSKDLRNDMRKVDAIWPGTDFTTVQTRIRLRNDFTSGPAAKNIDALNTAIHHADTAYGQIDALGNGDFKSANGLGNWLKSNVGDPRVDVLNSTLGVLNREVNKAIASGVVTNEDKQNFDNSLNSAQSSKVAKDVIDNYINLIAGRTQPLKERLDSYIPNSGIPVIRKSAQQILEKHGFSYDQDTGDINKSTNNTFSYKVGDTRMTPTGQVTRQADGTWR